MFILHIMPHVYICDLNRVTNLAAGDFFFFSSFFLWLVVRWLSALGSCITSVFGLCCILYYILCLFFLFISCYYLLMLIALFASPILVSHHLWNRGQVCIQNHKQQNNTLHFFYCTSTTNIAPVS